MTTPELPVLRSSCLRGQLEEVQLALGFQSKNQHQTRAGLERIFARCPISFSAILSNNGKEFGEVQKQENGYYKAKIEDEGRQHAVEILLQKMQIKQKCTKVRKPQTNDKVEKLNRTVSKELLTKIKFENRVHREADLQLWEHYYNQNRAHQGIQNNTPHQKLIKLSPFKLV